MALDRSDGPILVIHPDRKLQKTVHRIVGGTFRRVITVDDFGSALAQLGNVRPFIAIVDHRVVRDEEIRRQLRLLGDMPCLVLMQDSNPDELGPLLESGTLSFLMGNPMPLLAEELSSTVLKLLRRDIFGLEKYLMWGVQIRTLTLTKSADRSDLVSTFTSEVQSANLGPRAQASALVVDELLSNAVFNAPVDTAGVHTRAGENRVSPRLLVGRDVVTLRYACDARYLAIEVEDRYGSLDRNTIMRCLTKASTRGREKISMRTAGAGIGLATVYNNCNHLVFNLEPGRRTQAVALIDIRYRPTELGNSVNSFGIFSTEERTP
jgi:hypothetical protein